MGDETAIVKVILPLYFASEVVEGNVYCIKNVDVRIEEGKLIVIGSKKTKLNRCK